MTPFEDEYSEVDYLNDFNATDEDLMLSTMDLEEVFDSLIDSYCPLGLDSIYDCSSCVIHQTCNWITNDN